MGNSSSSTGGIVGSMILGTVFAPFTGGLSMVAASVGAVASGVALVKNIDDERKVENRTGRKTEFSPASFAIGLVGGGMMAAGGGLAMAGAAAVDISIGVAGVGVGLATSGDNKPKPYVGQQGSGIKQLEDRKNAEQAFKEEVKQIKVDDASKLNAAIAAISQAAAPQFGDPLKQMQLRLHLQQLQTKLTPTPLPYTKAPSSTVTNIYVIRRNLANIPAKGPIAHSGLLMRTDDNKYYILEYGVESDQNTVTIRSISADSITDKTFVDGDHVWDKQTFGANIREKNVKAEEVKNLMEKCVAALPYDLKYWNCHVAQENTRRKLGLTVERPYELNPIGSAEFAKRVKDL